MFKTRPCGCKGIRSCKICEENYGAWQVDSNLKKKKSYVYCPFCYTFWPGWDCMDFQKHPNHSGEPLKVRGVELVLDFISEEEESSLLKNIEEVPWDPSQSGRLKQNYGPKCNFKKKKVSPKNFNGYPLFTKFIQDRFKTLNLLEDFQTVEQCSLDYTTGRGASIDPHIDDCWIWGERIPTLSLCSDSVLTLNKFEGPKTRYNLEASFSYPRVVSEDETNDPSPDSDDCVNDEVILRVPMPRRSLLVLYSDARYAWEHSILREDIAQHRICITYRELTPPFLKGGEKAELGDEILEKSRLFWNHKEDIT